MTPLAYIILVALIVTHAISFIAGIAVGDIRNLESKPRPDEPDYWTGA